ncbi:IS110 family transposase [Streptomyces sp. NPDC054855]
MTVARASGCEVAYLQGLSMRRLGDLHPGTGKSDARDAYVIADATRNLPHLLHSIEADESVRPN